ELTENGRDNATDVTLTIDVAESHEGEKGHHILVPRAIICEDRGTGLTHREFLNRFCGAYAESEVHTETDRAGRNGVGTKTYTSISDRIVVRTTTWRATDGADEHRQGPANRPEAVVAAGEVLVGSGDRPLRPAFDAVRPYDEEQGDD